MVKNVLLIDDDPDDAIFFAEALKELSFPTTFRYIGNGLATLAELVKTGVYIPDIVFLDINMPMTNGWECLRELKSWAELGRIPVIMYSTADLAAGGMSPDDVGATAFMQKPTDFKELMKQLSVILAPLFDSSPQAEKANG